MTSRPRLVYVVTLAETGGAQSYVRDLVPAALEEYDVTVAAHGDGPLRTAIEAAGASFVSLKRMRRDVSPLNELPAIRELASLFRDISPAVVHLNSSKAGVLGRLAARSANVPVTIFTAHGWGFRSGGKAGAVFKQADRAVRSLATMVICVSNADREAGLAARVCTPERSVVIRNAVRVDPLEPSAKQDGGPVELVSVGRLAYPKDFGTLIDAVALLPRGSVHVRILGDGPLRVELERTISDHDLGAHVELVGEVPDVRPYLTTADMFVLSSRFEGMPIAILEAMACGLPVIASDVGGIGEVILEDETGYLVPPSNTDALAERLGQLVSDADTRQRFGKASYRRAQESFSLPRWQREHLELYRSLRSA